MPPEENAKLTHENAAGAGFANDADDEFYDDVPLVPRRRMNVSADMDITPMIDIVFLLLIFFLVSSTPERSTAVELPPARYGVGVSENNSLVISIVQPPGSENSQVFLADGRVGEPLSDDPEAKTSAIAAAVEDGFFRRSLSQVLIKAGRNVKRRDVHAVEIAVGKANIEGLKIYHGVFEKN